MFISAFLSWWYSKGWQQITSSLNPRLNDVLNTFSVEQLLKTLFSPWRRIITYPGVALSDRFRAWIDNLFSRTVGFFVRLIVLLAALLMAILVTVVTLLEIIVWPLVPISVIGLLIVGIVWH